MAPRLQQWFNAPGAPWPDGSPAGPEHAPTQHAKRDLGFSLVAIEERFAFLPDWYRRGEARDLALAYYFVLRDVLRSLPRLRVRLVRCQHCRIFFLCDPRNWGREDLGCPFGCADANRRRQSAERSAAYYQTLSGRVKKTRLNGKRRKGGESEGELAVVPAETEPAESQVLAETEPEKTDFPARIVDHVRTVTSLIEGRTVSLEEVVSMLERVVRQRSMVKETRREYFLRWLSQHPP